MKTSTLKKTRQRKSHAAKNAGLLWGGLALVAIIGWIAWNTLQGARGTDIVRLDTIGAGLGEIAPNFTVSTLEGGEFSLGEHRGNPTIIFFMAYWCGPCIPEAQALARLNQEYGNDINIIAIDIDATSSVDALNQFKLAADNGAYTWAFDFNQLVTNSYRVRALDTTLILDADGYIIYRDERPTDYKTLKNALESLEL